MWKQCSSSASIPGSAGTTRAAGRATVAQQDGGTPGESPRPAPPSPCRGDTAYCAPGSGPAADGGQLQLYCLGCLRGFWRRRQDLDNGAEHQADACFRDWEGHTVQVEASAVPLPESVTTPLEQLEKEIDAPTKTSPVAAVRASHRLEVTAERVGYWAARGTAADPDTRAGRDRPRARRGRSAEAAGPLRALESLPADLPRVRRSAARCDCALRGRTSRRATARRAAVHVSSSQLRGRSCPLRQRARADPTVPGVEQGPPRSRFRGGPGARGGVGVRRGGARADRRRRRGRGPGG